MTPRFSVLGRSCLGPLLTASLMLGPMVSGCASDSSATEAALEALPEVSAAVPAGDDDEAGTSFARARMAHYGFAHRLLPFEFHRDPERFFGHLSNGGGPLLQEMLDSYQEPFAVSEQIDSSELRYHEVRSPDGLQLSLVKLPDPSRPAEAYYVAMVMGAERPRYFTMEWMLDSTEVDPQAAFCEWALIQTGPAEAAVQPEGFPLTHLRFGQQTDRPTRDSLVEFVLNRLASESAGS